MTTFASMEELKQAKGVVLEAARTITATQSRIDAFADVTEDHQWIHVDPDRAAAGPFGATIAHGFLTLSLLAPFIAELLVVKGVSSSINYGLNRVRFPSPVPSGTELGARGRVLDVIDRSGSVDAVVEVTIGAPGADRPACIAESIIRFTP